MRVHDTFMFIWPLIMEFIMYVYILRKAKMKMNKEDYEDLAE